MWEKGPSFVTLRFACDATASTFNASDPVASIAPLGGNDTSVNAVAWLPMDKVRARLRRTLIAVLLICCGVDCASE